MSIATAAKQIVVDLMQIVVAGGEITNRHNLCER